MKIPKYPLEQLAAIKQKRLEEAERLLQEKRDALVAEQKKLEAKEAARDKVKAHKADKIQQMNDKFDEGVTSDEIEIMERYLKVVDEKLRAEEIKVQEQQKKVQAAEKAVEEAKQNLLKKQQEVEKLVIHRKEWEKDMKLLLQQQEGVEMDELGSASFVRKKYGRK